MHPNHGSSWNGLLNLGSLRRYVRELATAVHITISQLTSSLYLDTEDLRIKMIIGCDG